MEESNGGFELEVPGHQGRVIFVDRSAGIFTHSQCVEVVGTNGWFQQNPSIPSCSDTSVYQIDETAETEEQQFGWDLSMPHKEDLSGNSTQLQVQVSSSAVTEEQNGVANLTMQMLNTKVSNNTEAGNDNQKEVLIPVQSSIEQKGEVSPSIGPSSQFVSVIKQTPKKKSRRKSTTETHHLANEMLVLEGGMASNGISAPETQNLNLSTSSKTPRKRPRTSENENKPSKKKRNTSTKLQTPLAKFADLALAFLPRPEVKSKPEIDNVNNAVETPVSSKTPTGSRQDNMVSINIKLPEIDNINNVVETPVSSKTPKGSRQDNMVYINIKVMEIPPKEQKNWFADFSCTEPDSGSTSESPLKKKFAKTIKRAREVLCSKIWETVADSILVVEQVFGMKPIIKAGYRRPEGKPIMIRFISQLDPASGESISAPASSADIILSPSDDHGVSPQETGVDLLVPAFNQLPVTVPASNVAIDLSPKKSRNLIKPDVDIPHDLSTASSEFRAPNEISTQRGPGSSFQGISSDVVIGSSTDYLHSESVVSIEDIVDYSAPPGSRLNPFYFVNRANFKRMLSSGIKTDTLPVPTWIRSKLDSCGYLDVIRDRHHRREELEPFADGIVSYCYISVINQKPVSINIVYFRAYETGDMKMTMPKFCNGENTEGQKFYMFDDEASMKQEIKTIPQPSLIQNSDHNVDAEANLKQETKKKLQPSFIENSDHIVNAEANLKQETKKKLQPSFIENSDHIVNSEANLKQETKKKLQPSYTQNSDHIVNAEANLKQETKKKLQPSYTQNSDRIVDAEFSSLKLGKTQATALEKGVFDAVVPSQELEMSEKKLFKQAKFRKTPTTLQTSKNVQEMSTASADTQNKEQLSPKSVSATPVKRKKKTTKIAITVKRETKIKGKKSTGENSKLNQTPMTSEKPKPLAKKGRPRKLDSAVKISLVSPAVETPAGSGSSLMESTNKSIKTSTPVGDTMRCRRWFPNVAEQTKFYSVGKFLVLADQDDKPEVEVSVYKIIMCQDDRQLLKKFAAADFNGRVFHYATDTFVPLFGPVKELYSKYRPVICIKVHRSENGDNVIEIVKYFATPKMSHLLIYFDRTKDLFTSMRSVTVMLAREIVTIGHIRKKVLRTSSEYDESFATLWETLDFAINDRASTLIKEYGYQMDALLPVREHPQIKFIKADKSETKNGLECTPCKSKGRCRLATTKVQFFRKAYDRLTFENIDDTPAPPEDFGVCYTCRPRLKLLHKVLHHKWLVYAAVYNWISNLVGELEEDEVLDIYEVSSHIYEEYEWQWKSFFEFQSVLAEADREIEVLKKGQTQQAIHVKTE